MRLQKLKDVILPAPVGDVDAAKNEEAFAELIQFLNDKSLSLVMRDAMDDGKKALEILHQHCRIDCIEVVYSDVGVLIMLMRLNADW